MEMVRRQRKAQRISFAKAHLAFSTAMADGSTREQKTVAFQLLENKMAELDEAHAMYNHALYQSNLDDDAIAKELGTEDQYKTNFFTAKLRIADLLGTSGHAPIVSLGNDKKSLKHPSINLPKFTGNIKEWLLFWSQFKKIHDDPMISSEDKFQYLLRATVLGSKANELVNSFTPTGENYEKPVTCLKNRFGRDDTVVEFHVRELLGLVPQKAVKGNKRPSLASLYDKVQTNIGALETLGVTTGKYAAMLYPLVESSLPEDVLYAWQRSWQREAGDVNNRRETRDRLTKLLGFLQLEAENEERIDMTLNDYQRNKKWCGSRGAGKF